MTKYELNMVNTTELSKMEMNSTQKAIDTWRELGDLVSPKK